MVYGVIGPRDFGPGSKEYKNYPYVTRIMGEFADLDRLVSGGSLGLETLVQRWAEANGKELQVIPPNIRVHGIKAGFFLRNMEIVKRAEAMVIFWDGQMEGYTDVISHCMKEGKEVSVIPLQ